MVRVTKHLILNILLGGTLLAHADTGQKKTEKSILQREAEKILPRNLVGAASLDSWKTVAAKEADTFVVQLRKARDKSPALKKLVLKAQLASEILGDEQVSTRLKASLDKVSDKGWQETFKDLCAALAQKNLTLSNLSANSDMLKNFVAGLIVKERAFRAQNVRLKADSPITENYAAATPTGELAEGLKLLKVLSSFSEIKVEVGTDAELVKFFLVPTKADAK